MGFGFVILSNLVTPKRPFYYPTSSAFLHDLLHAVDCDSCRTVLPRHRRKQYSKDEVTTEYVLTGGERKQASIYAAYNLAREPITKV